MAEANGEKARGRGRIYDSISETIGETPLVRLDRIEPKRSPLQLAVTGDDAAQVLGYARYFAELLDEWSRFQRQQAAGNSCRSRNL